MNTLKEMLRQMAQDGLAEFRETRAGEEQLLFNDKGILVGNGKNAVAIYRSNMREFGEWAVTEGEDVYRLTRITRKKVSAEEVDSYFEEPAAPAKTTKTRKAGS